MGICGSKEDGDDSTAKKKSQEIDKQLEEDAKKIRKECKILLLGTHRALAGASTVLELYKR